MNAPIASTPALTLCELADTGVAGLESHSPFCLKAHRALRASGLSYARRHGEQPATFEHLNPAGQVPVLLVGDEPVADSTAIVARLESLGGRSLLPADPALRAEAWLWEELGDTALNGYLVASRWADERNWPLVREAYFAAMPALLRRVIPALLRRRVIETLRARDVWRRGPEACWARFSLTLDQLDARAPREGFWLGSEITVADISLFAQLHSLRSALTPWQREQVEARPALRAWLDRVDAATRS
ncbi:MAG: glutathione S-transferase family protein [Myxococcaceae bacterium]|nr:MAG: glutathione S-transferase family protein [Myxococcaceae bacterium]